MSPRKSKQKHANVRRSLSESNASTDQEQFFLKTLDLMSTLNAPGSPTNKTNEGEEKRQENFVENISIPSNGLQQSPHLPEEEGGRKRKSLLVLNHSTLVLEDANKHDKSPKKKQKRNHTGLETVSEDQEVASSAKFKQKRTVMNEELQTSDRQLSGTLESGPESESNLSSNGQRKKNADYLPPFTTQDQSFQNKFETDLAEKSTKSSTQNTEQKQKHQSSPFKKEKKKASKSQETNPFNADYSSSVKENPIKIKKKNNSQKCSKAEIQNEVLLQTYSSHKKKTLADVPPSTKIRQSSCPQDISQAISRKKENIVYDQIADIVDSPCEDTSLQGELKRLPKKKKKDKSNVNISLDWPLACLSSFGPRDNGKECSLKKKKKHKSDSDSVITRDEIPNAPSPQKIESNQKKHTPKKKSKKSIVSDSAEDMIESPREDASLQGGLEKPQKKRKKIKGNVKISPDWSMANLSSFDAHENGQECSPKKKKKRKSDSDSVIALEDVPNATSPQEIEGNKSNQKHSPKKKSKKSIVSDSAEDMIESPREDASLQGGLEKPKKKKKKGNAKVSPDRSMANLASFDAHENGQECSPNKKKKRKSESDSVIALEDGPNATSPQEIEGNKSNQKHSPKKKSKKSIVSESAENRIESPCEDASLQGELEKPPKKKKKKKDNMKISSDRSMANLSSLVPHENGQECSPKKKKKRKSDSDSVIASDDVPKATPPQKIKGVRSNHDYSPKKKSTASDSPEDRIESPCEDASLQGGLEKPPNKKKKKKDNMKISSDWSMANLSSLVPHEDGQECSSKKKKKHLSNSDSANTLDEIPNATSPQEIEGNNSDQKNSPKKKSQKSIVSESAKDRIESTREDVSLQGGLEKPKKKKKKGNAKISPDRSMASLSSFDAHDNGQECCPKKKKKRKSDSGSVICLEDVPNATSPQEIKGNKSNHEHSPKKKSKISIAYDCAEVGVDSPFADPKFKDVLDRLSNKMKSFKGNITIDLQSMPNDHVDDIEPRPRKKRKVEKKDKYPTDLEACGISFVELQRGDTEESSSESKKKLEALDAKRKQKDDKKKRRAQEKKQKTDEKKLLADEKKQNTEDKKHIASKQKKEQADEKKQRALNSKLAKKHIKPATQSCPKGPEQGDEQDADGLEVFNLLNEDDEDEEGDFPDFHPEVPKIPKLTMEQITEKVGNLTIIGNFPVHQEHLVEEGIFKEISKKFRELFSGFKMKTPGTRWTESEDKILIGNWDKFKKAYKFEGENDWQCFEQNKSLITTELLCFYRYLGQGLPKRTLQSIYCRFIHLQKHGPRKSRIGFLPAENAYILRFIRVYQKRDVYARLASILQRDRRCLRVHCQKLLSKGQKHSDKSCSVIDLSPECLTKVLQAIMQCTNCCTVKDLLGEEKIPCKEISMETDLTYTQVYRLWTTLLYSAIRIEKKMCLLPILLKTVEEIESQHCNTLKEVDWKKISDKIIFFHPVFLRLLVERYLSKVSREASDFKHSLQKVKLLVLQRNQKQALYKNEYVYPLNFTRDGTVLGFKTD